MITCVAACVRGHNVVVLLHAMMIGGCVVRIQFCSCRQLRGDSILPLLRRSATLFFEQFAEVPMEASSSDSETSAVAVTAAPPASSNDAVAKVHPRCSTHAPTLSVGHQLGGMLGLALESALSSTVS